MTTPPKNESILFDDGMPPHHGNENHLSGTPQDEPTRMNLMGRHMRLTSGILQNLERAIMKTFFDQLKDAYPKAPFYLIFDQGLYKQRYLKSSERKGGLRCIICALSSPLPPSKNMLINFLSLPKSFARVCCIFLTKPGTTSPWILSTSSMTTFNALFQHFQFDFV
ncbi:hypothetical protein K737_300291 [Holospora undulata HU1]|uniref:Uncharacterized protein n=3 Tax=Holosporaceae TaxID=44746 RepID=A0A061JI83_9PROT|nr:hypothetical protein K737_300291 [Holospora undulata HU1]GAJ46670.1 hypothetical protein HE1_01008 [Holospora elegans E1]